MCGIGGYIASQKLQGEAMLRSLHHRGPDHQGHFETTQAGKHIFLGHTRLSILDLSANGNQPMRSAAKKAMIIFNGEVYNFEELKRSKLAGEQFISRTDTEVVLKLYEKYGIDSVKELEGDFAFCIYDPGAGKIFLARDRAGVKPLYYYTDGSKFVFGSEIKSILAAGVEPVLETENLCDYFVFKYSSKNKTLFKNIHRLPPAHYLEYDLQKDQFPLHEYWHLHRDNQYTALSYSQASECLRELVKESVSQRLIADVPIGNFLSGGLDSSIIASFLKDRKDIIHYCARKSEADLRKEGTTSDFSHAQQLAKEWNLDLRGIDIGKEEASPELIRKTLFYSDDLIADGSQIPSYLITKEAAKTSKVILSGMGADELFLGYAGQMLTLVSSKFLDKIPFSKAIGGLGAKVDQGKGKFLAYRRYIHKMGKYHSLPAYKYALFNIVGDLDNSCSVYAGSKENVLEELTGYFPENEEVFDSLMHFEMQNFLVKNLHYMDRMAMANSVEGRVPFLSQKLIEFAYSIPLNYKLTWGGKFKRILKDSFKNEIPAHILKRRKAGFGMPLRSIFSNAQTVNSLLDRSFFANFPSFSVANINRIVQNHVEGKEDNSSIIYALISFREWHKLNFE